MSAATVAKPSMPMQASPPDVISDVMLEQATRRVANVGRVLAIELRDDAATNLQGEELDVDALAALATDAASNARLIQAASTRNCHRCGDPLTTIEDRKYGACEPCRENRKARRDIAARQEDR